MFILKSTSGTFIKAYSNPWLIINQVLTCVALYRSISIGFILIFRHVQLIILWSLRIVRCIFVLTCMKEFHHCSIFVYIIYLLCLK